MVEIKNEKLVDLIAKHGEDKLVEKLTKQRKVKNVCGASSFRIPSFGSSYICRVGGVPIGPRGFLDRRWVRRPDDRHPPNVSGRAIGQIERLQRVPR